MSDQFYREGDFAAWNEKMARKYDPEDYHLHSNFLIRWIERLRVKAILHFLDADQQDTVVEIGCGAGNVLEQVPSGQLHGIDLSIFLLRKSQRRLAHRQAKLIQANAERLPLASGRFHKLICTEVLEHVRNPRTVVSEMARVAASDAVLVISVPNETWIDRVKRTIGALGLKRLLLQGDVDSYHSPDQMTDEWHLHSFDIALLRQVCKDILTIERIKPIPSRLVPLRYVARCQVIE